MIKTGNFVHVIYLDALNSRTEGEDKRGVIWEKQAEESSRRQ